MTDAEKFKKTVSRYAAIDSDVRKLNERLSDIWYQLSGVKGVRFDRIPSTAPSSCLPDWKVDLYFEVEEIREEIRLLLAMKRYIEKVLDRMDPEIAWAVIEIYAKERRYIDVAPEIYMSPSGLAKRIEKEIEKGMHSLKKHVT